MRNGRRSERLRCGGGRALRHGGQARKCKPGRSRAFFWPGASPLGAAVAERWRAAARPGRSVWGSSLRPDACREHADCQGTAHRIRNKARANPGCGSIDQQATALLGWCRACRNAALVIIKAQAKATGRGYRDETAEQQQEEQQQDADRAAVKEQQEQEEGAAAGAISSSSSSSRQQRAAGGAAAARVRSSGGGLRPSEGAALARAWMPDARGVTERAAGDGGCGWTSSWPAAVHVEGRR